MQRLLHTLSSLLVGTLLAATAGAESVNIRPRGAAAPPPLTPEQKAARRLQKTEDMDAWLPRLVGRFKVEGIVSIDGGGGSQPATGKVDCIAVGSGPGVQCVIYVFWHEVWGDFTIPGRSPTLTAGIPFMGPSSVLYGTDPNAVAIRFMELDTDGLVTDGAAQFTGNTQYRKFEGYCPSEPQELCKTETRLYAPPHGRYLHLTIEIVPLSETSNGDAAVINLEITPVPQDETGAPLRAPAQNPG